MADFSDKYRKALDSLDISPDFKERTAAKMIALRELVDSTAETTVKSTAETGSEKAGNIILMNDNTSRKKKMRRMMYTVGAIAACAAVCMGVVFSGVLDGDKNVIRYEESETAVPEQTDVLPNEETVEEVSETVNTETAHDEAVVDDVSYAQTSEAAVTEAPEEEMPIETRGNTVTEANADKPVVTEVTVTEVPVTEAPVHGVLQNGGTEKPAAATAKTVPAVTTASSSRPAVTEALPIGDAEYAPPVGENTPHDVIDDEEVITESHTPAVSPEGTENDEAAGDYDYDGAAEEAPIPVTPVTSDNGSAPAFNDPAFSYNGAVGYDFSAYDETKKFDKKNTYATITPLFEEYDEKNGKIVSYNAAEVRGTVKMRELISAAALYAEDGTWEAVSAPPENSRYIIDFADEDGNSLRAYAGDGFICYAAADMKGNEPVNEVVYCYFKLTEKESKRLEGILYSYVD